MTKIIYVNHKAQHCGVYEFGKAIGNLLETSAKFQIKYVECDSFAELKKEINFHQPQVIIYNYHPSTMGWLSSEKRYIIPKTYFSPTSVYYKLFEQNR